MPFYFATMGAKVPKQKYAKRETPYKLCQVVKFYPNRCRDTSVDTYAKWCKHFLTLSEEAYSNCGNAKKSVNNIRITFHSPTAAVDTMSSLLSPPKENGRMNQFFVWVSFKLQVLLQRMQRE